MSLKNPDGMIEFLLLNLLQKEDNYGYGISKKIKELSGGHWDPSYGTIYGALNRLEKKKHIKRTKKEESERKYFKITEEGEKELKKLKKDIDQIKNDSKDMVLSFLNLYKKFHGQKEFKKLLKEIDNEFKTIQITFQ